MIFPPVCFRLASSWSKIPDDVVRTMYLYTMEGKNRGKHVVYHNSSNKNVIFVGGTISLQL